MPKETLGYMKLEWTCSWCNSRNPGLQKTCLSCGAPQPEDVAFHLPEKQDLITDESEIAQAKKAPISIAPIVARATSPMPRFVFNAAEAYKEAFKGSMERYSARFTRRRKYNQFCALIVLPPTIPKH